MKTKTKGKSIATSNACNIYLSPPLYSLVQSSGARQTKFNAFVGLIIIRGEENTLREVWVPVKRATYQEQVLANLPQMQTAMQGSPNYR